jgi:hypothetical protein
VVHDDLVCSTTTFWVYLYASDHFPPTAYFKQIQFSRKNERIVQFANSAVPCSPPHFWTGYTRCFKTIVGKFIGEGWFVRIPPYWSSKPNDDVLHVLQVKTGQQDKNEQQRYAKQPEADAAMDHEQLVETRQIETMLAARPTRSVPGSERDAKRARCRSCWCD